MMMLRWVLLVLGFVGSAVALEAPQQSVLKIGKRSRLLSLPLPQQEETETPLVPESSALKARVVHRVPPGPWGDLEYYVIYLQDPNAVDKAGTMYSETHWCFPRHTEKEALEKLSAVGIDKNLLQRNSYTLSTLAETRFVPSVKLVRSLAPEIRPRLRALLKQWPQNGLYRDPVVVESGNPLTWYADAGLSSNTVRLISSLCYTQGNSVVFSEVPAVLSSIRDQAEKERFLKAITRTRTMVLRLNISETTDIEAVRDYWTIGNRRKEILPIFESVFETVDVEKLDVVHLLPPSARKRLYTYSETPDGLNCHLNSLEFAGVVPDEQKVQAEQWADLFKENLVPAKGALQFGDILALFDKDSDELIPSAVYIAADIVFTKNGLDSSRPWVFMLWSDMLSIYGFDAKTYTKVYRAP